MKRPAAFSVRFWHPKLRAYRSRAFHAFDEAALFLRARRADAIPPALLNHLGHVWTGQRSREGRPIWTTEDLWAEAA